MSLLIYANQLVFDVMQTYLSPIICYTSILVFFLIFYNFLYNEIKDIFFVIKLKAIPPAISQWNMKVNFITLSPSCS